MVLFTSAIVVGALLLLGAALNALLAKSLYTQQSADAVQQVKQLTRQTELPCDGVKTLPPCLAPGLAGRCRPA